jgi:hypothetical protein
MWNSDIYERKSGIHKVCIRLSLRGIFNGEFRENDYYDRNASKGKY